MSKYFFPKDLLVGIKSRWNAVPAQQEFELPDDEMLQRLLETCYHASFRTAEHRPVHCVVAYAPIAQVPAEPLLLLQHPVVLTDDQIVRLAPVADIRRTLIGCDYIGGRLQIWGLFEHGHALVDYFAGDPSDAPIEGTDVPPECLTITVEQPGALSVSRGRRGLVRLRDGRIIVPQENPMRSMEAPLGRYFRQLVDDLRHSPPYRDRALEESADDRSLLGIYTTSVAAILERIRRRREGGSIVITRSPLDSTLAQITYTVAEHTGLTGDIVNYYEALGNRLRTTRARSDVVGELDKCRAEAVLRQSSQQLFQRMNQISLLASVDGAVLLDGHLRIQGFGVSFTVMLPIGTTIFDSATGIEHACDRWGLRHQSVFSVCQKCEQAVGLIVSQDGGVKAVKSDEGRLYLWNGILD